MLISKRQNHKFQISEIKHKAPVQQHIWMIRRKQRRLLRVLNLILKLIQIKVLLTP